MDTGTESTLRDFFMDISELCHLWPVDLEQSSTASVRVDSFLVSCRHTSSLLDLSPPCLLLHLMSCQSSSSLLVKPLQVEPMIHEDFETARPWAFGFGFPIQEVNESASHV
jgi:hypothetical protein